MAAASDNEGGGGNGTSASAARSVDTRVVGAEEGMSRCLPQSRAATSITQQIADLKVEQAAVRNARARVQKDLKNAQRRKRRLKARVRQLTNEDLVAVMIMRNEGHGAASSTTTAAAHAGTGEGGEDRSRE